MSETDARKAYIAEITSWARKTGAVLTEAHEEMAKFYSVATDGVRYARRIPSLYSGDPS